MRRSPHDLLAPSLGMLQARQVLNRLDNGGYVIISKSEHLDLRRAKIKLAKTNGAGSGARTGRLSVKKPNLAQAPRGRKATKPVVVTEAMKKAGLGPKARKVAAKPTLAES